jgi:hypothetical protein
MSAAEKARVHSVLERAERDVRKGQIPGFTIATLLDVPADEGHRAKWTKWDSATASRYETVVPEKEVPGFWPSRPWDSPADQMPPEISQQLALRIASAAFPAKREGRAVEKQNEERPKLLFGFPKLDYETDDIDEITQGEL